MGANTDFKQFIRDLRRQGWIEEKVGNAVKMHHPDGGYVSLRRFGDVAAKRNAQQRVDQLEKENAEKKRKAIADLNAGTAVASTIEIDRDMKTGRNSFERWTGKSGPSSKYKTPEPFNPAFVLPVESPSVKHNNAQPVETKVSNNVSPIKPPPSKETSLDDVLLEMLHMNERMAALQKTLLDLPRAITAAIIAELPTPPLVVNTHEPPATKPTRRDRVAFNTQHFSDLVVNGSKSVELENIKEARYMASGAISWANGRGWKFKTVTTDKMLTVIRVS